MVGARDGKKLGLSWDRVISVLTLSQPGMFQTFAYSRMKVSNGPMGVTENEKYKLNFSFKKITAGTPITKGSTIHSSVSLSYSGPQNVSYPNIRGPEELFEDLPYILLRQKGMTEILKEKTETNFKQY